MTEQELREQLEREYDRVIADTLTKLKKCRPLTKQELAKALFEANKAYWAARLALIDADMVYEAERVAAALSVPYANAMETFSDRVRNIYAGYQSAFDLSQKDAKELLGKVEYERSIAESLKAIADDMPDGEDKTRILAEISAPAYRYRLQRAEQMCEQAKEVCDDIARGEIRTDRALLQTQTEKAYNITADEIIGGREPARTVIEEIAPEYEQLHLLEMPKSETPIEDFTPTADSGVLDSFSLINSKAVKEITEREWSGSSFSESVWDNTDELAREIKQVLLEGELTGASEADMADKVRERFNVAMYKARRVVRTESNYCVNQAELKGLRDAGYDEYEFMSLHEERDCEHCDDLDGQVFKISDAAVGVNCPPIHPFCRCKVTAKEETLEEIQADIDRILEGTSIEELERKLDEMIAEKEARENSSSGVDNSENSGIIENERQTSSAAFAVPKGMTESREFREKFNSMSDDTNIQREYYQAAKEMLHHRSGNNGEDLYYYNTRTGVWYKSTTGTEKGKPDYNEIIKRGLEESKRGEIVSFHNHPEGMPPSDSDLNAAFDNGYSKGYTLGHNGRIFEYTPPQYRIDESVYINRVSSYKADGLSEYESQLKALFDLKELYGFEIREV